MPQKTQQQQEPEANGSFVVIGGDEGTDNSGNNPISSNNDAANDSVTTASISLEPSFSVSQDGDGNNNNNSNNNNGSNDNGNGGDETTPSNHLMQLMRKGVFGKSVTYLQTSPQGVDADEGDDNGNDNDNNKDKDKEKEKEKEESEKDEDKNKGDGDASDKVNVNVSDNSNGDDGNNVDADADAAGQQQGTQKSDICESKTEECKKDENKDEEKDVDSDKNNDKDEADKDMDKSKEKEKDEDEEIDVDGQSVEDHQEEVMTSCSNQATEKPDASTAEEKTNQEEQNLDHGNEPSTTTASAADEETAEKTMETNDTDIVTTSTSSSNNADKVDSEHDKIGSETINNEKEEEEEEDNLASQSQSEPEKMEEVKESEKMEEDNKTEEEEEEEKKDDNDNKDEEDKEESKDNDKEKDEDQGQDKDQQDQQEESNKEDKECDAVNNQSNDHVSLAEKESIEKPEEHIDEENKEEEEVSKDETSTSTVAKKDTSITAVAAAEPNNLPTIKAGTSERNDADDEEQTSLEENLEKTAKGDEEDNKETDDKNKDDKDKEDNDNDNDNDNDDNDSDDEQKAALERRRSLRTPRQVSYSDKRTVSATTTSATKAAKGTVKKDAKKIEPPVETTTTTTVTAAAPVVQSAQSEIANRRPKRALREKESTVVENLVTPKRRALPKAGSSKKPAVAEGRSFERHKATSTTTKTTSNNDSSGCDVDDDDDPFNLESNFNNHPLPLRNIQMERQSFGNIKYTKASLTPDTSTNRYEKTEQTASERRSNLSNLFPPTQHGILHKSLSELSTIPARVQHKSKKGSTSNDDLRSDSDTDKRQAKRALSIDNQSDSSATTRSQRKKGRKSETTPAESATKRRKIEETPNERTLPELDVDEQFSADHPANEHAPYDIGARVYALWGRQYYAAKVSEERDSSGRYELMFVEDQQVRRLVITGIISLNALVVGKKCITTIKKNDEEVYEEVEIISSPSNEDKQQWMDAMFRVKSVEDEQEYTVSWDKLVLSWNHASALATTKINTACDVMTDNIDSAEARRSRAKRHTHAIEDVAPLRSMRTPKRGMKKDNHKNDNIEESVSPTNGDGDAKSRSVEKTQVPFGKIFNGIAVVVTSAMRKNKDEEQAFSKREIRQLIEQHGGTVLDDFSKITSNQKVLLIADTHYRTHKYLSALARSVPCVRHQWIRDCVAQNKLLDYNDYMLPAGVSLLTSKIVPWHANNGRLLEGKRVLLSTRNFYPEPQMPNFTEIWTPLIKQMGAIVVDKMPADGVDILLTDASCADDVLAEARSCNAIIVSSEWIIQSIIHGSLPDPKAHERFQHNFVDM